MRLPPINLISIRQRSPNPLSIQIESFSDFLSIFSISVTSLKLFFFNCIFSISPDPSHRWSESVAPAAASGMAEPVVDDRGTEEVDYVKLAAELERASPLKVMDRALAMFGDDIAIAFSGVEDVALIEYARLIGRPFMVFSLDIGRLDPETYRFFDAVEKHYDIHIEYMFPDAVEVQAMVRTKGEEGPAAAAGAERPEGLGHRAMEGLVPRHQSPNSHCSGISSGMITLEKCQNIQVLERGKQTCDWL